MRALLCGLIPLLAGCSLGPNHGRVVRDLSSEGRAVTLERSVMLQTGGSVDCGAEALHAVMQYHGGGPGLDELSAELAVPGVPGTFPQLIIQSARRHGYSARAVDGSPEALMAAIDAGVPPIILGRLGATSNHFMIPTAYEPSGNWFACAFYDGQSWILTAQELEEVWRPCGYLQLEFLPDPQAEVLLQARILEEGGQWDGALALYRQVLAASPDRWDARIGAGNCLALKGAWAEARSEYLVAQEAGAIDPELLNNLAEASLALGDTSDLVLSWAIAAVHAYRGELERGDEPIPRAVLTRKLALTLGTLAAVHLERGEIPLALGCYQTSLDLLPAGEDELRQRRRVQIAECNQRLVSEPNDS